MLQIGRLEKRYPSFSLEIGPLDIKCGEIVALVGPNGAGKTTLMRGLLGIIRPDILDFTLDRKHLELGSPFPREIIGYVPEEPILFESETVERLLRFVSGFFAEWDQDLAKSLLSRFEVDAKKKIRALSKGMRTKVLLVMALARSAKVLFFDEPTSGLDPVSREAFWDFVAGLCQRGRIQAALVSTHQLEEVQDFCNRAIFLKRGRIIYDKQNFSREELQDLFREAVPSGRTLWQ